MEISNMKFNFTVFFIFIFYLSGSLINASSNADLKYIDVDLTDKTALQRGAKIYFEQCQGCHSIKYMRYSSLAEGIGFIPDKNNSIEKMIKELFMHSVNGINENGPILSSISKENGVKWFGKNPPDLSLISRYRGIDWLYTYMKSFYKDQTRPWGVNNLLFPDVGMPHILVKYQGVQILKDHSGKIKDIDEILELAENGELSKNEYNVMIKDLVTFLSYVGEPIQTERYDLGIKVLIFLIILSVLLFFLKKEYWKDIK